MALQLAVAQPSMYGTAKENTADLLSVLAQATGHGAQLYVSPELAWTGFHRSISEATWQEVVRP